MPNDQTYWRTIAFTAAAPGWKVLCFENESGPNTSDLAGWAVQEECILGSRSCLINNPDELRYTRIVACDVNGSECEPVDELSNFWRLVSPSDETPSAETYEKAYEEYLERRAAYDAAVRKKAATCTTSR
jgi:hypothetical protein